MSRVAADPYNPGLVDVYAEYSGSDFAGWTDNGTGSVLDIVWNDTDQLLGLRITNVLAGLTIMATSPPFPVDPGTPTIYEIDVRIDASPSAISFFAANAGLTNAYWEAVCLSTGRFTRRADVGTGVTSYLNNHQSALSMYASAAGNYDFTIYNLRLEKAVT